jgi:hypothetical protein
LATDIWLAVGRILDHGEETLSQCFRDSTSCSQQFARVDLRLFAKVVRQYGYSLPRSAWHDENNCTPRFRQQAALRDQTNVTGTGN